MDKVTENFIGILLRHVNMSLWSLLLSVHSNCYIQEAQLLLGERATRKPANDC